ncbi:MAG: hypothetical protein AB1896_04535, partial [Thermodesulfobacteriota bacterium]
MAAWPSAAGWFGNPLEWRYVDKTLLLLIGHGLVLLAPVLWLYRCLRPGVPIPAFFDSTALSQGFRINLAFLALIIALVLATLVVRRLAPLGRWPAYVAAVLLSGNDAFIMAMIGHTTNSFTLLLLFLLVFLGLLLFDFLFVLAALAAWILVIGGHLLAERLGLIPYGWLLSGPPFR